MAGELFIAAKSGDSFRRSVYTPSKKPGAADVRTVLTFNAKEFRPVSTLSELELKAIQSDLGRGLNVYINDANNRIRFSEEWTNKLAKGEIESVIDGAVKVEPDEPAEAVDATLDFDPDDTAEFSPAELSGESVEANPETPDEPAEAVDDGIGFNPESGKSGAAATPKRARTRR